MTGRGPGVRVPPPVVALACLLAGYALHRLFPVPLGPPAPALGTAVLLLAFALSGWTIAVMLRAGTDPRPDRPDNALLADGPFRLTRNPIYLGFVLALAGVALLWGDLWGWVAAAVAWALLDRTVVAREEAYLAARFGAAYASYRTRVRRWL